MSERPDLAPIDEPAHLLDDAQLLQAVQIAKAAAIEQKPKRLVGSHKWCVYTCAQGVLSLREAGIRCRAVQLLDWSYRADSGAWVTREDGGFQHGDASDVSHTWIELIDGTILDPTITQFKMKRDWPSLPGLHSVAVIRPGDEYASHYDATPQPGNEHQWNPNGHTHQAWDTPESGISV